VTNQLDIFDPFGTGPASKASDPFDFHAPPPSKPATSSSDLVADLLNKVAAKSTPAANPYPPSNGPFAPPPGFYPPPGYSSYPSQPVYPPYSQYPAQQGPPVYQQQPAAKVLAYLCVCFLVMFLNVFAVQESV